MKELKFKPLELAAQAQNPDAFWKGAEFGTRWTGDLLTRKIADHIRSNKTPNLPLDALIVLDEVLSEIEGAFSDARLPKREPA